MGFGVYKLILTLNFIIYYIYELAKVTRFSESQFTHLSNEINNLIWFLGWGKMRL